MPHIFEQIEQGQQLLALFETARTAGANAYSIPKPAEEITRDPHASTMLPIFGMVFKEINTYANEHQASRRVSIWQSNHYFNVFWLEFRSLKGAITTAADESGLVTQRISAEAALSFWHTSCGVPSWSKRPDIEHASYHFAAALARHGGIPWQRDGDNLVRELPKQALRLVPQEGVTPPTMESAQRVVVPCVGYAYIKANTRANPEPQNALVYVSGVGDHKKLRAFAASLQTSNRHPCLLPDWEQEYSGTRQTWVRARRPEGKGIYRTFWNDEPLAESGAAHLVMLHHSALEPRSLEPFLHLTGEDGNPDLDMFFRALDVASPYPLKRAWAERLWDEGLKAKLITKLPSYACAAFWCDPTDEATWARIVAACQGAETASVQTFGEEADETSGLVVPVDMTI